MSQEPDDTRPGVQTRAGGPNVRWDDAAMRSSSANGCNAAKRRNLLLTRLSREYEPQYGKLLIEAGDPQSA